MKSLPHYAKNLAKIAAIIALMGSLVWVQWPIDLSKVSPGALLTFVAAFIAWVSFELEDLSSVLKIENRKMNEDVEKINSLIGIIDKKQYYILRNNAIETTMQNDDYEGLSKLLDYYEDDIFPFNNRDVQAKYEKFCRDSEDFLNELMSIYNKGSNGWMTWRPDNGSWVSQDKYDYVMNKINELNIKSRNLNDSWISFLKLASKSLSGASISIERYK
ncbi:hypothetical protein ACVNHC_16100 [Pannonibacter sp. Q-1]